MFGWIGRKKKQNQDFQRSENVSLDLYAALGILQEIRMENDDGPLFAAMDEEKEMPPLSGMQEKVTLIRAANGITMIKESDGQPVTERRSLSQEDLGKVPEDAEEIHFVNLTVPSKYDKDEKEIYSCLIVQPDSQVFGNMRAFWWSLAKMHVEGITRILGRTKMTEQAYAHVFANAQMMWNIVIEESGTIDHLRDQLVPIRNVHLDVISQMKDQAASDADRLGLDIALAMVLATQSEDKKLEAEAFDRFKKFLWQPGDEPKEFYMHEAA